MYLANKMGTLSTIAIFTFLQLYWTDASSVLSFYNSDLNVKIQAPFSFTEDAPKNCHNVAPYFKADRGDSVVSVSCIQVWNGSGCQGKSQKIRTSALSNRSPEQISKVPFEIRSFQLCSECQSDRNLEIDNTTVSRNVTKTINEIGLELHNKYRSIHGAPSLVIEEELVSSDDVLQRFKGFSSERRRRFAVKKIVNEEIYGENEAYIDGAKSEVEAVKQAIEIWYAENVNYDYSNPGYDDETRHFTQMVWKSTTEFAIGVYRFESNDPNWNTFFVMARYKPYGNIDGMFQENVLPPKSS